MKVKDILLNEPSLHVSRQPLITLSEIWSLLWFGIRALGLGFMIIGVVATSIILAIEQGLLVGADEEYSPKQLIDKICIENGGMVDHAIFHIGANDFAVNTCTWGLNEQSDETSPGVPRSTEPSDSKDTTAPVKRSTEETEVRT